jgi:hypothetical protein
VLRDYSRVWSCHLKLRPHTDLELSFWDMGWTATALSGVFFCTHLFPQETACTRPRIEPLR